MPRCPMPSDVTDCTKGMRLCLKHSEPVANLLALSRHVVIVLSCPRQVFQPEKVASLSQTPTNLSETCLPARASGPASIMDFGLNGVKGSKFLVENAIFGIADPDLPIHYATFTELRWWLRVVYTWAPQLLSIFRRKKNLSAVCFGRKLNVSFITSKRHILAWFHV